MNRIIGIPSDGNELSDEISTHFGHCRYFIGVKVLDENKFKKTFILTNEGHTGCMEPVINMKQREVTDMILTGIGMRPFMGFQQVQINLHQGIEGSIEKNIKMLLRGQLKPLYNASCAAHSDQPHTH